MVKTGAGREGNRFLGVKGEIVGSPGTKELPAFPGSALKSLNPLQCGWGEALRQLPATFDYLESANPLCPLREGIADNYIALKRKKKKMQLGCPKQGRSGSRGGSWRLWGEKKPHIRKL